MARIYYIFKRNYSFMPMTVASFICLVLPFLMAGHSCLVQAAEQLDPEYGDAIPAPQEEYETLDSLYHLYQPYIGNVSAYEPIYFLVGTDPKKSKFQFSFKYRLVNPEGDLSRKHSWVEGLHFAYTQTSFWNLKDKSLPFEDTSYKPEFFHLSRNIGLRPSWMQGLFLQTGIRHESNGQAEPLSRSTNYLYVRPYFVFYSKKTKLGLGIAPKVWVYFDNSNDNPDLPDYRGYFELFAAVGKADSFVLTGNFRMASEGGSVQLGLSYPVGRYLSDNIDLYLNVEYVNVLAESLLFYNERTEALRLGISFVR